MAPVPFRGWDAQPGKIKTFHHDTCTALRSVHTCPGRKCRGCRREHDGTQRYTREMKEKSQNLLFFVLLCALCGEALGFRNITLRNIN